MNVKAKKKLASSVATSNRPWLFSENPGPDPVEKKKKKTNR